MKTIAYKRGKYKKQNPKELKITFLIEKQMMSSLRQLSGIKQTSVSHVIREAIQEYYNRMVTNHT